MARYDVDGTSAMAPEEDENPVLRLVKDSITPDVTGRENIAPDGSKKQNSKIINFNDAKQKLSNSESAAGDKLGQDAKSLGDIRDKESKAGGLYSGAGKVAAAATGGKGAGKGKGFLKKGLPITGSILTIVLFGVLSFGSLSTQIVAWKENMYSMFGQNSAIMNRRSNFMMNALLDTERSTTKNSIFGGSKFKISSKLADKLKAQGIEYIETNDANGKKIKMLVFEDTDGAAVPVVSRKKDISRANSLAGTEVEVDGKTLKLKGAGMTLSEARTNNADFDTKFHTATITFTGKIAGWFDNVADIMFERIVGKGARNKTDIDDPDEEKVNKMLLENVSDGAEDSENIHSGKEENEDGKLVDVDEPDGSKVISSDGDTYGSVKSTSDTVKPSESGTGSIKSISDRAKKAAMVGANVGCMFLRGIGAISTTVGAIMTANVIQYASKYLEIADKIKAGKGDEVTNVSMDNINKPVKTTAIDASGKKVELEGSVSDSAGWNAPFSDKNIIDENDPSAYMVNRENTTKSALMQIASGGSDFTGVNTAIAGLVGSVAGFGAGVKAFHICTGLQAITGVVDGVSDIVTFVLAPGAGKALKEIFVGAVKGAALSIVMIAINAVISLATPAIASWFVSSLENVFLGKNGGFALFSGGHKIMHTNLKSSTGKLADKDNAIEMFALTKDVEKEWAAYERATKSPFDITSKYTFFGNIVNSIVPIANSSSSILTSVVSPVAMLTGSSALAIINPTASAAEEASEFSASLASEDNCAYLSSVGVAGDFACNEYVGAYVDEIETMDPDNIYQYMDSINSFDGEDDKGNPKINANSNYAKYIVACVTSDTQPGTMNGAVEGFIQKATTTGDVAADSLISFGSNFVPFEGFLDGMDALEQEINYKWNSGLACTGNTGDSSIDEQVRNFSMYNLDQRVLNEMGVLETNSTVSFLEDYYKENPLDQSFEGKIARFSGMTKEQVSNTLALIEYYNYIANYDASERYAFGEPAVKVEQELIFDNDNQVANEPIITLMNQIVYPDIRNRNFVA